MDRSAYDSQYWKFSAYGFLKNLKFFDPFIILFLLDTGLSFLEIGVLVSLREITINVVEIPSGIIADSLGRRKSMIFSFLVYIISFVIFFFSESFPALAAAMFFFGLGEAFRSGTHKAMILEYLKLKGLLKHKVDYYGHTRSWSQTGSAVSAVLAGAIVFFSTGYRYVFIFSVIPYLIEFFLIWSYPEELDYSSKEGERDKVNMGLKESIKALFMTFKNRSARKIFISSSLFDAVFKVLKDYIQPVMLAMAVSLPLLQNYNEEKKISIISALVYFILYMLTSYAAKQSGRFSGMMKTEQDGINITFMAGVVLIGLIGVFEFTNLSYVPVVFFILYYLLQNLRRPAVLGLLSSNIPHEVMASGLSVESQLKTVLVAVIAPLCGLLIDSVKMGPAFMVIAAVLLLVSPLVMLKK